jgi:hypothetical protein
MTKGRMTKVRMTPSVLGGILRLARFDRRGFAAFPATKDGFLASLAPIFGFALVGAGLSLIDHDGLVAVAELGATVCAALTPAVLSHGFAQVWRREERWLTYATAFNWCQWAIPVAAVVFIVLAALLNSAGLPTRWVSVSALSGVLVYALILHWFLARYGLALSAWRAIGLVAGTNIGTALVVLVPRVAVVMTGLDS